MHRAGAALRVRDLGAHKYDGDAPHPLPTRNRAPISRRLAKEQAPKPMDTQKDICFNGLRQAKDPLGARAPDIRTTSRSSSAQVVIGQTLYVQPSGQRWVQPLLHFRDNPM